MNPLDTAWRDPLEVSVFPPLNPSKGMAMPLPQPISAPASASAAPEKKGFLQKTMDVGTKVSNALGLGSTVDYLGNIGANLANPKLGSQGLIPQPNLKQAVGAGLQLGSFAGGAGITGATPGIARAALAGGLSGAASSGGQALASDQSLRTAGEQALKGGALGAALGGGMATLGRFLERSGDKIQFSVIKPTKQDLDDGFTIETVKKYNLGGSLNKVFKKTESLMDDLTKDLNARLGASQNRIDLGQVLSRTTERLQNERLSTFGANTSTNKAVDWLGKEIAAVGNDISVPEGNVVKRAVGHYGAWTHGLIDPETTAQQKVANVFYNELKKEIENQSPEGVRAVNQKLSELIPVLNAVIRRIPIAERNNALSLTDIISLVGSAIEPRALGLTMLNFISKSGAVGNAMSRAGGKVVKGATPLGYLLGAINPTEPEYETTKP